jgi:hypothetical protein
LNLTLPRKAIEDFLRPEGLYPYMFAVPTGAESLQFTLEQPSQDKFKRKILLILRANPPVKGI